MACGVVRVYKGWYMRLPVALPVFAEGANHIHEGLIEPLGHTITLRVIWSRPTLVYPSNVTKFPNYRTFKVAALVAVNATRESVVNYKMFK